MNTTNIPFALPSLNTLAQEVINTATNVFTPEAPYTTADFLLRVASRRQYVRAVQAMRRR